jgi:hypothetical protein
VVDGIGCAFGDHVGKVVEAEVGVEVVFADVVFVVEGAFGHGALFVQRDGDSVFVATDRADFLDSAGGCFFS